MTRQQYRRWYDFSYRMAHRAFPNATPQRRKKIAEEVRHIIWCMEDEISEITDWDSSPVYPGDRCNEALNEHYHEKVDRDGNCEPGRNRFHNQVSCCVRAGLDQACAPSGGVLGFTVGDLRRMYPFGLPAWVVEGYEPPITAATDDGDGVWL